MAAGMLAFAFGIIVLHAFGSLPGSLVLVLGGCAAGLCLLTRRLRPLGCFVLGLLYAAIQAQAALEHRLPKSLEGVDLAVVGEIVDLPEREPRLTKFRLQPSALGDLPPHQLPRLIKLNWYGQAPDLRPGDVWRFTVKLKRPHGLMNPGGFDYERWLFAQGIDASGYVREQAGAERVSQGQSLDRLRLAIADRLQQPLSQHAAAGVVLALVVGDKRLISPQQWEWFRLTGTGHLVAISGLHVAMVAGLIYLAVGFGWRCAPRLCLALPAPIAATAAAAVAALIYAGLAGFSLPTQRALIMLAVPALGLLARRHWRAWRAWTLALVAVLLWDPFAPLTPGFWLSFGAVAVLLAVAAAKDAARWPLRYLRPQLTISLALLPLTALWFYQAAWLSPLSNLVAIPLVSFIIVPLALGATALIFIIPPLGEVLLVLCAQLTALFLRGLEALARLDRGASDLVALPWWAIALGFLAAMIAVMPRGLLSRWLILPLMLPFVVYRPVTAEDGQRASVTVLDAGQGLAVVAEIDGRVLVYDTGPAFGDWDTGAAVLLPFLRSRGIGAVDLLVVSHGDNDHSGGAGALIEAIDVREIVGGDPLPASDRERPCRAGDHWSWGSAELSMLWPPGDGVLEGNNASCVLVLAAGGVRVLLTGDVEAVVERVLVSEQGERLRADVLIVPHHGSRTSSTADFVAAVQPQVAVISAGYRNRYGFPRQEVVETYREAGTRILATYGNGAIRFELREEAVGRPESFRRESARYYHEAPVEL